MKCDFNGRMKVFLLSVNDDVVIKGYLGSVVMWNVGIEVINFMEVGVFGWGIIV